MNRCVQNILPRRRYPRRRERSGPEARLLRAALSGSLPSDRGGMRVLFREPVLATGFPDAVLVYPHRGRTSHPLFSTRLQRAELQVFHHISGREAICSGELATQLALPRSTLETLLLNLERASLIRRTNQVVAPNRRSFPAARIVSIEAKLNKWRVALKQAIANTWYASHSCILLPSGAVCPEALEQANEYGIGVWSFDSGRIREEVAPRQFQLPSSYASWMLCSWLGPWKGAEGARPRKDLGRFS